MPHGSFLICIFLQTYSPTPYALPSALYPRKEFRLPDILSVEQFSKLYGSITNVKHKAIIGLMYGSGIRLGELRMLKMSDIDSKNYQLKVVCGKEGWTLIKCPVDLFSDEPACGWWTEAKEFD